MADIVSFEDALKKKGKQQRSKPFCLPPIPKTPASLEADFDAKFQRLLEAIEQLTIDCQVNREAIQELIRRLRKANVKI